MPRSETKSYNKTTLFTLEIQTDKTIIVLSKTKFLVKTMLRTLRNQFWNSCCRSSARSESRSRSCHFKDISSRLTPGRECSVLIKPPVLSYHVLKFLAKIPTRWQMFILLSEKFFFPKGLMGHVECTFNNPAEEAIGCTRSIRNFSLRKL